MQSATDHAGKPLTKNEHLIKWVEEIARLTKPDTIVWCDGSEEERHRLTEQAVQSQDIATVQGVVMFVAACFVTVNFIVDVSILHFEFGAFALIAL